MKTRKKSWGHTTQLGRITCVFGQKRFGKQQALRRCLPHWFYLAARATAVSHRLRGVCSNPQTDLSRYRINTASIYHGPWTVAYTHIIKIHTKKNNSTDKKLLTTCMNMNKMYVCSVILCFVRYTYLMSSWSLKISLYSSDIHSLELVPPALSIIAISWIASTISILWARENWKSNLGRIYKTNHINIIKLNLICDSGTHMHKSIKNAKYL